MAWCRAGDEPSPESMIYFSGAYKSLTKAPTQCKDGLSMYDDFHDKDNSLNFIMRMNPNTGATAFL